MTPGQDGADPTGIPRLDLSIHPGNSPADPDRPPALLLHPWFGCRPMWSSLAARLDTKSCAVDWYSIAENAGPQGWSRWASPHGLAEATLSMLAAEGIGQVDVIGNSVGGIVAQILAIEHPERVRRLVLIGTGAALDGPPTAFGSLVARWVDEPDDRDELAGQLVDALVAHPFSPADREEYVAAVRAADPDFLAAVLTAARTIDLRSSLPSISAPTLVLRGEHDTARTPAHVAELLAGIPDARAVELPGCGHSPMVEDVDRTATLTQDHLRSP